MTGPAEPCPGRCRRGDQGLTTISWMLILAAVAGLAALAVILVQRNVEVTGVQISNPDPRTASAIQTAFEVETGAKTAPADDFKHWDDWERYFTEKCAVIAILYSGAQVVHNEFNRALGGTAYDAAAATHAAAATEQPPGRARAQVQCQVG